MLAFLKRLLERRQPAEDPAAGQGIEEHRLRRRVSVSLMASLEIPGERSLTCLVADATRDGVRLTLPHAAVPRGAARLRLTFNGFEMTRSIRFVWNSGVNAGARFEGSPTCPLLDSFERFIEWRRWA